MATLIGKLRALRSKPLDVAVFRLRQEATLLRLARTGGFGRLARSTKRRWDKAHTDRFLRHRAGHGVSVVLNSAALSRARKIESDAPELAAAIRSAADAVRTGRHTLLGTPIPPLDTIDWHVDSRFGHRWEPAYFRSYVHYAARGVPFDVKFPWELSRLQFLLPLLQENAALAESSGALEVGRILADWETQNPLAYSVAWYPMEASMRTITLAVLLDFAVALALADPGQETLVQRIARLLADHAAFVWLAREYSDVRGNHYAANVVALLAAGAALDGFEPAAPRWLSFGLTEQSREIPLQFLRDGGNFEKSLPYHRLVTELFLLGLIVAERLGRPDRAASERVLAAVDFLAAMRRPDGLVPVFGDCDDAKALGFDTLPARAGDPVAMLAAAWARRPFDGDEAPAGEAALAAHWLTGRRPAAQPHASAPALLDFKESGFIVARAAGSMLVVDAGEVGLKGRGGHGHNDITSFELVLDGLPLIVDPGCPVYTGDTNKRNVYRGTRAHNVLIVEDREFAPMSGMWRISDAAGPRNVAVARDDATITIRVGHRGYDGLDPAFRSIRQFTFASDGGAVEIRDEVSSGRPRRIERRFHCDTGLDVTVDGSRAFVAKGDARFIVEALDETTFRRVDGAVSPGYGVERPAAVLVLEGTVEGDVVLAVRVRRAQRIAPAKDRD